MYKKIEILGLRGFNEKQTLNIAVPKNGNNGSGLTVIVGPNNSGKSTIYEAFRAISQNQTPSFTEGKRNKIAGDKIEISIFDIDDNSLTLKTTSNGGSETEYISNKLEKEKVKFLTLPSRRTFSPFFGKSIYDRNQYISTSNLQAVRGSQFDNFSHRLFQIQKDPTTFNSELSKVLGYSPNWNIDQADNGNYYLKFINDNSSHNSDGAGEGLLSVFTIVDALYDSRSEDLIFIDEPELSLHPSLQRKLLKLLLEYSKDRQIIISTHSPFFVSWPSILNGGRIARTVKETSGTKIYQLEEKTTNDITPFLDNLNNPHILGLDASEIFFLEDNIILTEGQEDVVFLNKILEIKQIQTNGVFYGWGVGGAPNTRKVIKMLEDLGFKKITSILDNNMSSLACSLSKEFPKYNFVCIPTNDIRDKPEVKHRDGVSGLIDTSGKNIKTKYEARIIEIFNEINNYFLKD
ncbi:MAG: ATP-binding protein [Candidatus Pacebacteria bacterium]|nr:ATP-binding protein [Candidatus Paceibacterota bacterium]